MSSGDLDSKVLRSRFGVFGQSFSKIPQIIKEFKVPKREVAVHAPLSPKAAGNVKGLLCT